MGFSHFARHYSGNDLFSSGYLDVSVPQVPFTILCVQIVIQVVRTCGFPHSDISGSAPVHGSPKLIAVSRVLHRQFAPRHPPLALSSFHVMRRIRNSFKIQLEISFKTWPTYYSVINVLSGYPSAVRRLSSVECLSRPPSGPFNPCQPPIRLSSFTLSHSSCGDEGTRTPDLRLAKALLSRLSYIPGCRAVGLSGLEPETLPLSEARSNQLS